MRVCTNPIPGSVPRVEDINSSQPFVIHMWNEEGRRGRKKWLERLKTDDSILSAFFPPAPTSWRYMPARMLAAWEHQRFQVYLSPAMQPPPPHSSSTWQSALLLLVCFATQAQGSHVHFSISLSPGSCTHDKKQDRPCVSRLRIYFYIITDAVSRIHCTLIWKLAVFYARLLLIYIIIRHCILVL